MPKKPTEKSKYPSIYSPGVYVSCEKFICELLCQRHAYFENKDLPVKFWELPRWKTEFVKKIVHINRLLGQYSEEVIIKALRDPKGRRLYSATSPKLKPLLEKYASMPQVSIKEDIEELEENLGLRKPSNEKKNLRSKLDEV